MSLWSFVINWLTHDTMEISCMVKRHVFVSVSKSVNFSFGLLCFLSEYDRFPERSLEVFFLNSEKMNWRKQMNKFWTGSTAEKKERIRWQEFDLGGLPSSKNSRKKAASMTKTVLRFTSEQRSEIHRQTNRQIIGLTDMQVKVDRNMDGRTNKWTKKQGRIHGTRCA